MQSSCQILLSVLEVLEVKPQDRNKQGVLGSYVTVSTRDGDRFTVFAPSDVQIAPGFDGYMLCSVSGVDHFTSFQGRQNFRRALIPAYVLRWKPVNRVVHSGDVWNELNKK